MSTVFWNRQGILLVEFLPRGETINETQLAAIDFGVCWALENYKLINIHTDNRSSIEALRSARPRSAFIISVKNFYMAGDLVGLEWVKVHVGDPGNMVQCVQCPTAFHFRESCIAAGSVEKNSSTIICPYHFVGKQRVSPQKTCNLNICSVCNSGGELVCCEACPHAFHKNCLKTAVPNEDFLCEDCTNRRYLLYGMVVWGKMGHYRWWPAQIIHSSHLPQNVEKVEAL
ncbi:Histone-lysine N-methyltransferase, H3 lysine-36 and H4 lysine-20 specific [Araneus ventricosus]|uniref:Histone-lysine N-methyltransferase, H3 lysine-36 and H4 lysine-20 specific n=1 Tax=Araneus ventricosus TaxID=182803 RepID=A0A4Y2RD33_ARAVE|nr:Histone-lysine N-methyltransferase, H3 lysine-36 and H4 lysine-20 specific [Araneus ventricosus]